MAAKDGSAATGRRRRRRNDDATANDGIGETESVRDCEWVQGSDAVQPTDRIRRAAAEPAATAATKRESCFFRLKVEFFGTYEIVTTFTFTERYTFLHNLEERSSPLHSS